MVFPNLPWLDDWTVINRLMEYLNGRISLLTYIFSRHNVHFIVPARFAFLISYENLKLNLAAVRWGSLVVIGATAALYARVFSVDISNKKNGTRTMVLIYLFILALIVMPIVTLGQWEIFSVAMDISNVVANLAAIAGIICFDRFLRKQSYIDYWVAILLALCSWQSMANGALLFGVYLIAILLEKELRNKYIQILIILFCALAIPIVEARAAHATSDLVAVFTGQYSLKRCVLGALSILGVGIIWGVHNKPYLPGVFTAGGIVCIGSIYVLWNYIGIPRSNSNIKSFLRKYWMLTLFGVLSDIAVYFGRIHFGATYLASSRYIPISMLAIIGIAAYMYLLSCGPATRTTPTTINDSRVRSAYSVILYTAIFIGFLVTNVSEVQMAQYRRASYIEASQYLRSGQVNLTSSRKRLYLQSNQLSVMPTVVEWLKKNHLSLFNRHDHP